MSKESPVFFIDHSALQSMFEGKKSGDKLVKKLYDLKNSGVEVIAYTSLSCFLRAIYLSDSNTSVNAIQKVLTFLRIGFSLADFKNEKAVIDEVLKIVDSISKRKENEK